MRRSRHCLKGIGPLLGDGGDNCRFVVTAFLATRGRTDGRKPVFTGVTLPFGRVWIGFGAKSEVTEGMCHCASLPTRDMAPAGLSVRLLASAVSSGRWDCRAGKTSIPPTSL